MTTTDRPALPRGATQQGGLTPALSATGTSTRTVGSSAGQSTLRGGRLDQPELPEGQLQLQPPPQIEQAEGASGVLMNAIPMLGSLGSIVLVATMSGASTGGRQYIAAGMFLFATLGFVVVQIDRQRKQRIQQVTGTRTEYLRYLGNVRQLAREAADQQRRALTWHHPDPARAARDRRGPHPASGSTAAPTRSSCTSATACATSRSRSSWCRRRARPIDQVDPAAASALHRLLVVHRLQPDLPASVDLRAFDRIEVCGPEEPARSLARAMICSATAFHAPEHLVVAVLTTEQNLAHWDWVKWLPHGQSAQQSDAVGPRRMVSTSLDELAGLLPADLGERPRFGAEERPGHAAHPVRHRRRRAAARQPRRPARRRARRDRAGPAGPLGRARGRDPAAAAVRGRRGGRGAGRRPLPGAGAAAARRGDPRPRSTSARWPPPRRSHAGSPRCTR